MSKQWVLAYLQETFLGQKHIDLLRARRSTWEVLLRVNMGGCFQYFGMQHPVGFHTDFSANGYTPPPPHPREASVKLIIAWVAMARLVVVWQD